MHVIGVGGVMMRSFSFVAALALATAMGAGGAASGQAPPVEHFARAPALESAAISPDGSRIAYVTENEGQPVLAVVNADTGAIETVVSSGDTKARSVRWAADDVVLFIVSDTDSAYGYRGSYEFAGAFGVDLSDRDARPRQLLRPGDDIDSQTNYANIVGIDWANDRVLMQAYSNRNFDLFAVNPRNGRNRRRERGVDNTRDWVVDGNGEAVARLDYSDELNQLSVSVSVDGRWRRAVQDRVDIPDLAIAGLAPDGETIAVAAASGPRNASGLYALDPNSGAYDTPLFAPDDVDVSAYVIDPYTNRLIGARYHRESPQVHWFDADLAALQTSLESLFEGAMVGVRSWSRDRSRIILRVQDTDLAPEWFFLDLASNNLSRLSAEHPELQAIALPSRTPYSFAARDGVEIPGYLTLPVGAGSAPLPLVVFPHGGPASRDIGGFDAWAHLFASRGYAVLQPNFRGSEGYGAGYERAGHGGWGTGVMQHDLTDGVRALIAQGRVDPARVCIVGASYGGYAALAGATFTPDLYACAAAIAPVSDLREMMRWIRDRLGSQHWAYDYWRDTTGGDVEANRERLDAVSPARHAARITAPVLLIHGRDDTVVPIDQSRTMEQALRRAGAAVDLVELRGGDHWLLRTDTRIEAMRAIDAFLAQHLQ